MQVLIVDDREIDRELIKLLIMQEHPHAVIVSYSGAEAEKKGHLICGYDLVVIDYDLGVFDAPYLIKKHGLAEKNRQVLTVSAFSHHAGVIDKAEIYRKIGDEDKNSRAWA